MSEEKKHEELLPEKFEPIKVGKSSYVVSHHYIFIAGDDDVWVHSIPFLPSEVKLPEGIDPKKAWFSVVVKAPENGFVINLIMPEDVASKLALGLAFHVSQLRMLREITMQKIHKEEEVTPA